MLLIANNIISPWLKSLRYFLWDETKAIYFPLRNCRYDMRLAATNFLTVICIVYMSAGSFTGKHLGWTFS